jgi:DNA polymerase family B
VIATSWSKSTLTVSSNGYFCSKGEGCYQGQRWLQNLDRGQGLDMKRRDYCELSKTVSQYTLDQILSGEATEIVVECIHEYLISIGEDVRAGKVKLNEFIIYKRLGKRTVRTTRPDAKSQPMCKSRSK